MSAPEEASALDGQIGLWRAHLERRGAMGTADVDELEDHLRGHVEALLDAGLSDEEAFLVAVKRLGSQDAIAREFAQENSKRLWKQLVLGGAPTQRADARAGGLAAVAFAVLGGLLVQVPRLWSAGEELYLRNASLLGLAALVAYLLWRRPQGRTFALATLGALVGVAVVANVLPLDAHSDAMLVTALHVPILTWLVVGVAYAGRRWRDVDGRMEAVRFSGEWVIYMALLAAGGGALAGVTVAVSQAAGVDAGLFVEGWLIPSGAAGAVVIAAWLVDSKQSVIENMAPVLARVFTPLFALTFVALLAVVALSGQALALDRDVLLVCDAVLVIAVALVLYSLTARPDDAVAGWFERTQLALVGGALVLDAVALVNIVGRLDDGWTINRAVVLGINVILLVNLAVTGWLLVRLLRDHPGATRALERWQTGLLVVYGAWAVVAILILPPLLGRV
ncbi:permease prefix domain 1-containing protein [Demequina sp. NBRC 110056]|uniref:permease prefix domain 1-containing protein n=1 Tax=Demequina sp. NBRC 110056 TaxID=1570345 RepID=UPI000A006974|nr:permease prefix domain 1-containing protein [Demequina sp. NBRC 110056]